MDLLQGLKKKNAYLYLNVCVCDICTIMRSGVAALKSATMLRAAIAEFLPVW